MPGGDPPVRQPNPVTLDEARLKIVAGQAEEAVVVLRRMKEEYPKHPEVLELLGLALREKEEYWEAAFMLEEAGLVPGGSHRSLAEAGEAYELALDEASATRCYATYLEREPDDAFRWLAYARLLRGPGKETLNAYERALDLAEPPDLLAMGELYRKQGILPMAAHFFRKAEEKAPGASAEPNLGLLNVLLAQGETAKAEALVLDLSEAHPGSLNGSSWAEPAAELLRRRRAGDFFARGEDPDGKSPETLASILREPVAIDLAADSKLPPGKVPVVAVELDPVISEPDAGEIRLSDILGFPDQNATPANPADLTDDEKERVFLEKADFAMARQDYRSALRFVTQALKANPESPVGWHKASQAHFLLGETEEAEMKAMETVRLAPENLGFRMDLLRIAIETQTDSQYLEELEKAHEGFPVSMEILWKLARHYHLAENKPTTAANLYQKLLEQAPPNHPLRAEALRELNALRGS